MKYPTVIPCLLLLTAGCVPMGQPQSPAANGRIIDADSRIPVSQAHVFFRGYPKSEAMTGTNGCFRIDPNFKTRWLPPLPFDFHIPPGILMVEASGYQTIIFDQAAQPPGTIVSGRDFELELKKQ